jgi:hypothetical protein
MQPTSLPLAINSKVTCRDIETSEVCCQLLPLPGFMGTADSVDTYLFKQLAREMYTEAQRFSAPSGPESILRCLKTTNTAMSHRLEADDLEGPNAFIQAHGLDVLISLLTSPPTPGTPKDANSISSQIAIEAGVILSAVVVNSGLRIGFAASAIPHFMDVLRDEPHHVPRLVAAQALKIIADTDPAARRTMAEAGAMGLVLGFIAEVGNANKQQLLPAYHLARVLLRSETAAVHDLQRAICGPSVDVAYPSIEVLEVCCRAPERSPLLQGLSIHYIFWCLTATQGRRLCNL